MNVRRNVLRIACRIAMMDDGLLHLAVFDETALAITLVLRDGGETSMIDGASVPFWGV